MAMDYINFLLQKCETCRETNRRDVTGPLIQCKRKRCAKAFHPVSLLFIDLLLYCTVLYSILFDRRRFVARRN